MNYKNRRPKAYKGHCGMCAEGRGRNQRALTMQERRAPEIDLEEALSMLDEEKSCVCIRFGLPCPAFSAEAST